MAAEKYVYIRNLTSRPVNLRLGSKGSPYYLTLGEGAEPGLKRRGEYGDVAQIPATLSGHPSFVRSKGILFEVVPEAEAHAIDYAPVVDDEDWEKRVPAKADAPIRSHTIADEHQLVANEYEEAIGKTGRLQDVLKSDRLRAGVKRRRVDPHQAVDPNERLGPRGIDEAPRPPTVTRRGR